jgi:hypothetical protein
VDTLPQFAKLAGDTENAAGAALDAMEPLQGAAAEGLAVLISRHDRKSGGDVGDSGRGSGAFTGSVDIVLALRRGGDGERPTVRHLHSLSRFDELPDELVIELTAEGYNVVGDAAAYARLEARQKVLDALPAEGSEGLSMDELVSETGARRTTVRAVVGGLVADGSVSRTGTGKRGEPYRFAVSGAPATISPETSPETARLSGGPIYVLQEHRSAEESEPARQKPGSPETGDLTRQAEAIFGELGGRWVQA